MLGDALTDCGVKSGEIALASLIGYFQELIFNSRASHHPWNEMRGKCDVVQGIGLSVSAQIPGTWPCVEIYRLQQGRPRDDIRVGKIEDVDMAAHETPKSIRVEIIPRIQCVPQ